MEDDQSLSELSDGAAELVESDTENITPTVLESPSVASGEGPSVWDLQDSQEENYFEMGGCTPGYDEFTPQDKALPFSPAGGVKRGKSPKPTGVPNPSSSSDMPRKAHVFDEVPTPKKRKIVDRIPIRGESDEPESIQQMKLKLNALRKQKSSLNHVLSL